MFKPLALSLLTGLAFSMTAGLVRADILIEDAYARASSPNAKSGAAFMTLRNTGTQDDRLISVSTPIAGKAEAHSTTEDANGVVRMVAIEGGLGLSAGCAVHLQRGGKHIMMMGLKAPLSQGDSFPLTLQFEKAGAMTVDIPVDMTRLPGAPVISGHMNHDHGDAGNGEISHDDIDHSGLDHSAEDSHDMDHCAQKIAH